jgi:hypothetical protein
MSGELKRRWSELFGQLIGWLYTGWRFWGGCGLDIIAAAIIWAGVAYNQPWLIGLGLFIAGVFLVWFLPIVLLLATAIAIEIVGIPIRIVQLAIVNPAMSMIHALSQSRRVRK